MFYLLCLTLCLAVMVLVTTGTLLLSVPLARLLRPVLLRLPSGAASNLGLAFRIFPFLVGAVASAGLALPAFFEFEPRSTHEMLDWPLLSLAVLAALALITLFVRAWRLLYSTRKWLIEQRQSAQPLGVKGAAELYCVSNATSLLAVAGVFRPAVFVSANVAEALTPDELDAAIRHELAHVHSWDNVKQFVLKVIRLPRWIKPLHELDHAWIQSSEIAADERALATGAPPLELSSALIKVARLAAGQSGYQTVAASHLVPCECNSATATRAARLREILESGKVPRTQENPALRLLGAVLAGSAIYLVCLATLLPAVHEVLEILVR
ncbi:MAG TPA: M56 family metallopeptidase [Candidatus Limnocylindrales bacterium]|jgi:Zn-dependent protease with chaperone function|nr:M56 family metallopeptidase [Candidatus Limnocylindrales bacterium]